MFSDGDINIQISVASPNGRGVFPKHFSGSDRDSDALVVVSGLSCRFDQVAVRDSASLTARLPSEGDTEVLQRCGIMRTARRRRGG